MSTSSTSGIHVGIHGEQLPNALQRHYLLFATLATQRPSVPWALGPRLALARARFFYHLPYHLPRLLPSFACVLRIALRRCNAIVQLT